MGLRPLDIFLLLQAYISNCQVIKYLYIFKQYVFCSENKQSLYFANLEKQTQSLQSHAYDFSGRQLEVQSDLAELKCRI